MRHGSEKRRHDLQWRTASKSVSEMTSSCPVTAYAPEVPWYSQASLCGPGHVFHAGTLAQCVRKWVRLPSISQTSAYIQLTKPFDGSARLEGRDIAALAAHPEFPVV
jgi:hypothetical protein